MPIQIGHRGACGYIRNGDNTLESIKKAISLNVDVIEIDIRVSKDNDLVVTHDNILNQKPISQYTTEELKKLNIITLEDVFNIETTIPFMLDIKSPYNVDLIIDILYKYKPEELYIACVYETLLNTIKTKFPQYKYGLIEDHGYINPPNICSKYNFVSLQYSHLNIPKLKEYHDVNLKIFVYTVNKPGDIETCIDWNVDGLITDFPK